MLEALTWLTPAGVGAATAVLVQVATLLLTKSRIRVDDGAALRKDLLTEREQLVAEIQSLSERFAVLEKENHELRLAQVELEKKTGMLELEKARYQSEAEVTINTLKAQIQALQKI